MNEQFPGPEHEDEPFDPIEALDEFTADFAALLEAKKQQDPTAAEIEQKIIASFEEKEYVDMRDLYAQACISYWESANPEYEEETSALIIRALPYLEDCIIEKFSDARPEDAIRDDLMGIKVWGNRTVARMAREFKYGPNSGN